MFLRKWTIKTFDKDLLEIFKHSKNYFFVNIATFGLYIITTPIFTRLLTQKEFGIVALFFALTSLIAPLNSLNIFRSVERYYFEENKDYSNFLGTSFLLIIASNAIFFILFIWGTSFIDIFSFSHFSDVIIVFLLIYSISFNINQFYISILIPKKISDQIAKIRIYSAYINTGLALIIILLLGSDKYLGQIMSIAIVTFIFSIYSFIKVLQEIKISIQKDHIKYIANYSFPFVPYNFSSQLLSQMDKFLIVELISLFYVGIYSVGFNFASFLIMIIMAIEMAFMPDFMNYYNTKEIKRIEILSKKIFSLILLAALFLILFASEFFTLLIDQKFYSALDIVPILIVSLVFFSIHSFYERYILYSKKTYYLFIIMTITMIFNLILNLIMIPIYGYEIAAYIKLVSYLILATFSFFTVKTILKHQIVPISAFIKLLIIFFVFIALYFISNSIITNFIYILLFKILLFFLFFLIVFKLYLTSKMIKET